MSLHLIARLHRKGGYSPPGVRRRGPARARPTMSSSTGKVAGASVGTFTTGMIDLQLAEFWFSPSEWNCRRTSVVY